MICANKGKKSDILIRDPKELRRIWFFKRFRARFFWPGNPKKCHAEAKHGPQVNLHQQYDRLVGRSDLGLNHVRAVSRFYSLDFMWKAREAFLRENEAMMSALVKQHGGGNPTGPISFTQSIDMRVPVGEGLVAPPFGEIKKNERKNRQAYLPTLESGAKLIRDLKVVTLKFEYEEGNWYEITAYPDIQKAFDVLSAAPEGSGSVIQLPER